jgi:hypothetical protein
MLPSETIAKILRSTRGTAPLSRILSKELRLETNLDFALTELTTPILPKELEDAAFSLKSFLACHFRVDCYAGPGSGDVLNIFKRDITTGKEEDVIQAGDDSEAYMWPDKHQNWESSYWVDMAIQDENEFNSDIYLKNSVRVAQDRNDSKYSAYTAATYKRLRRKDVLVSVNMIYFIYAKRLQEYVIKTGYTLNETCGKYIRRTVDQLSDLGLVFAYAWLLGNKIDLTQVEEETFISAEFVDEELINELTEEVIILASRLAVNYI